MVLQPCVSLRGVLFHCLRHEMGMRGHCPTAYRHPRAIFLPEQLINRYTRVLPHQVVHRCPQSEGDFVPHPVKGIGSDVTVDYLLRLRAPALSQPNESIVRVHDVHGARDGTVEVVELIRDPVHIFECDWWTSISVTFMLFSPDGACF